MATMVRRPNVLPLVTQSRSHSRSSHREQVGPVANFFQLACKLRQNFGTSYSRLHRLFPTVPMRGDQRKFRKANRYVRPSGETRRKINTSAETDISGRCGKFRLLRADAPDFSRP